MAEKLAYNSKEAAAALGVSLPTFYELSNRDDFPVVRVGRRVLVPVEGLRAWLEKEANKGA
jgi:excisionase family DNA binding protein